MTSTSHSGPRPGKGDREHDTVSGELADGHQHQERRQRHRKRTGNDRQRISHDRYPGEEQRPSAVPGIPSDSLIVAARQNRKPAAIPKSGKKAAAETIREGADRKSTRLNSSH